MRYEVWFDNGRMVLGREYKVNGICGGALYGDEGCWRNECEVE